MKNELKKLNDIENSLTAPWDLKGMTVEDYINDLTIRLKEVQEVIEGRRTDTSIVKSTVTETLQFIAWANAKKELSSAVALIRANLVKAQVQSHGKPNRSRTKRID